MNIFYRIVGILMWPVFWLVFPVRKRSALLIIVDKEVLVVKHKIYFGSWNLPGGGVKRGEKPGESVVREVYEELHIEIEANDIRELSASYETIKEFGITSRQQFFIYEPSVKPIIQQNNEILAYAWVTSGSTLFGADTRRALELLEML